VLRATLVVLALTLAAGGCISVGIGEADAPAQVQYRLEDRTPPPANAGTPVPRSLVIVALPSAGVGDSFSMAYSRAPQQRSLYQHASWTDRPSVRIVQLMARRIDARGLFKSVTELGHGIRGDLVLNVMVDELVHDTASARARVHVTAELIDRSNRMLVARRRFEAAAPVAQENSAAAADAMSRAVTTVIDDMMAWLEPAASRLPAAAAR
jgi:ABC-type uncharacterized transport system auxiliary subunit